MITCNICMQSKSSMAMADDIRDDNDTHEQTRQGEEERDRFCAAKSKYKKKTPKR